MILRFCRNRCAGQASSHGHSDFAFTLHTCPYVAFRRLTLPVAAGNCLDIEINITFPGNAGVPVEFGSVGVSVLGSPACAKSPSSSPLSPPSPASSASSPSSSQASLSSPSSVGPLSSAPPPPSRREAAVFDAVQHGPHVSVIASAGGSLASWGGSSMSCNEVAFVDVPKASTASTSVQSYWVILGDVGEWQDIGWCSRSVDASGATWIGPDPKCVRLDDDAAFSCNSFALGATILQLELFSSFFSFFLLVSFFYATNSCSCFGRLM